MKAILRTFLLFLAALVPLLVHAQAEAPDVAKWTASVPADAAPNSKATVTLTATLDAGWHVYGQRVVEDGPTPTKIEAVDPVKLDGKAKETNVLNHLDPNFQKNVDYFDKTAVFEVPVQLGADPKKGALKVTYQACNDKTCHLPKTVEVPLTGGEAKVVVQKGDVAGTAADGLGSFLLTAFGAGLIALLTPCVFPMIPITVSYFSKQKEKSDSKKVGLSYALAYCGGIVGAYTGVGLLVAVVFGASGLQNFAANPWVNIVLAAVFILLALNLFGIMEVSLPTKMTNAFSPHSKSGLIAPLLMGLTFTMTSFTCTGPFVGTILVTAAKGDLLYPFLGMLAFSTAFAMPFFLLALFPQYLARLPKSGSWLELIKAFMGFVELAAALKFISNSDLVWGTGLLSRATFLLIWAVIFVGAALFLSGVLKLAKIEMPAKMGKGRMLTIAGTACLAAWLAFGGVTGKSLGDIEAFLPPGKSDGWEEHYDRAVAMAKRDNKPMLIDFTGVTCTNCRWMEKNMFPRPKVAAEFKNFVLTKLFTDRPQDRPNQDLMRKLTGKVTMPIYVIMSPEGKVLRVFEGSTPQENLYLSFLDPKASTAVASR